MTTDTFPTLAEYRHPAMKASVIELRSDERFVAVMGFLDQVFADVGDLPPAMQARLWHDLVTDLPVRMSVARGAALHSLLYDHTYEEVAALTGLSRQRIHQIHSEWLTRTSTDPWPKVGKWSRVVSRRQEIEDAT